MIWLNTYIALGCLGVSGVGLHLWAWLRVRELQRLWERSLWAYESEVTP